MRSERRSSWRRQDSQLRVMMTSWLLCQKMTVDMPSMILTLSPRRTARRAKFSSLPGHHLHLVSALRCYMQRQRIASGARSMESIMRFKQLTPLRWSLKCSEIVQINAKKKKKRSTAGPVITAFHKHYMVQKLGL